MLMQNILRNKQQALEEQDARLEEAQTLLGQTLTEQVGQR